MNRVGAALLSILGSLASACGPPGEPPPPTPPRQLSCTDTTGIVAQHAVVQDRRVLGLASRYPADGAMRARTETLRTSQRARREAAWQAVARVLAPVPLDVATPVADASVPRFRTWYDREDIARTFQHAYESIGREARAARAPFTEASLDEAFGWNVRLVESLETWPAPRWEAYLASLDTPTALNSLGGIRRIALSPDAARHIVASYSQVLSCLESGAPPAFVDAAPESTQRLAREPLSLAPCATRTHGPYFVASGSELRASLEGAGATLGEVRVSEGAAPATSTVRCRASGTGTCVATGPGVFYVTAASGVTALLGMLEVRHTAPAAAIAACLDGVFPVNAATVAMEWHRSDAGLRFPTYDTSAQGLARRLAPGADATWGEGDGEAAPSNSEIYTMRVPSGGEFQLAGMHIRTRELDNWLNITLWWSPRPDEDFGADRPEEVRALGGVWSSYKMCVSIDFDEQDADPSGGYESTHPTLAAALRAVHEGRGAPSWCSNPYIDGAPGLVRSNCVGCHQHAMSGIRPAGTVNHEESFPGSGRLRLRNNYPADQFWGLDGGDDLAAVIRETVDYWATER